MHKIVSGWKPTTGLDKNSGHYISLARVVYKFFVGGKKDINEGYCQVASFFFKFGYTFSETSFLF